MLRERQERGRFRSDVRGVRVVRARRIWGMRGANASQCAKEALVVGDSVKMLVALDLCVE